VKPYHFKLSFLYAAAIIAAAIIYPLVIIVFWSTFIEGIPSTKNLFSFFLLHNNRQVFPSPLLPAATYNTVEVTTALFLLGPRNMVLSTVTWNRWVTGETDIAAPISSIMVGVMAIIVLVLLNVFPKMMK